jgi:methionyl-tRNA synthetase
MSKNFYLTTPLYYSTGVPHVGHVCTTAAADAIARYRRMSGVEVCELTGADEHGLKVERMARQQGLTPQQLADASAEGFKAAWSALRIQYDEFVRTTDSRHAAAVQELFRKLKAKRFVYLGEVRGPYCVNCEAFLAGDRKVCPECGETAESVSEASYFFKLSQFQEKLVAFYQDNPGFVTPQTRMSEITSLAKSGLEDLSISRTSFSWGIPVPGDEKHVFYVWFDALAAYLSGAGFPDDMDRFGRLWPADVQLMGYDALRFHAVYWPALLMAAGLEPPRRILAHSWWTIEGQKVSKGKGTPISARELSEHVPADYIKYYLVREMPLAADTDFTYEGLVNRVNNDLAGEFGNLASRIVKMIENYFQGTVPEPREAEGGDDELRRFSRETIQLYSEHFDRLSLNKALDSVWELTKVLNKYVVANEPWLLARDLSKRARLGTVLYHAAEGLRIIATMLAPFAPDGAAAIIRNLGFQDPPESHENHKVSLLNWGGLKAGSQVGAADSPFPRLDIAEILGRISAKRRQNRDQAAEQAKPAPQAGTAEIGIDDFAKIELRVGKIISAERVPRSDKLVKLQVDIGAETRQLVAGIGKAYAPEDLPGRLVVVLVNLKPAKLMGVTSNGMIVAASDGGVPVLATFTEPVVVGSRLK